MRMEYQYIPNSKKKKRKVIYFYEKDGQSRSEYCGTQHLDVSGAWHFTKPISEKHSKIFQEYNG